MLCHTGTSVHLLPLPPPPHPPPPGYWHTYFFLLAAPDHLHEKRSFSVFAKSLGPCKYVFIPIPSLSPPYISTAGVSPISHYFLALAFPFFLSFFYCCLLPPKIICGHHLFLVSPYICFHAFSTTLSHLIPARPFVTFSQTALSTMPGNLCVGRSLT